MSWTITSATLARVFCSTNGDCNKISGIRFWVKAVATRLSVAKLYFASFITFLFRMKYFEFKIAKCPFLCTYNWDFRVPFLSSRGAIWFRYELDLIRTTSPQILHTMEAVLQKLSCDQSDTHYPYTDRQTHKILLDSSKYPVKKASLRSAN